jgi:hypothetical protein
MDIHINYDAFREICMAETESFNALGKVVETSTGRNYIYIDRGSPVLGVAHLDSVQDDKHFSVLELGGKHPWVFSPQLDDRLGVYVLLHLLPSLGIHTDVLLTDDEETGNSTAKFFKTDKHYNWMFQFDRKGDDVVHYMYDYEFLKKRLRKAGFNKISHGAASDICKLEHLGCMGFNVGTGYQDEHTMWAKADMEVLKSQVEKFVIFFQKYETLHFRHEKKPVAVQTYNTGYDPEFFKNNEWDWQRRVYVPKGTASVVSTKKCEHCKVTLQIYNTRTSDFDDLCDNCAPMYFGCVICGNRHRTTKMRRIGVCENCLPIIESSDPEKVDTVLECGMPHCVNTLSYAEFTDGGICKLCLGEEMGGFFPPNDDEPFPLFD